MKPPCTYIVPTEKTNPIFGKAFAKGCRGRLTDQLVLKDGEDVAMFGSPALWPLLQLAQRSGRTWFYADHGYIARFKQFRITKNGYQHPGVGNDDPTRFTQMGVRVEPWRRAGDDILICPQTATYHQLFGMDVDEWVVGLIDELRLYTDRRIVIRTKTDAIPIAEALKTAWAVVSFSSAVAIDALIAGVPNFTLAPWASAFAMGTPDLSRIEDPYYPEDRERFLAVLMNNQWTLEEITRGVAWAALSR